MENILHIIMILVSTYLIIGVIYSIIKVISCFIAVFNYSGLGQCGGSGQEEIYLLFGWWLWPLFLYHDLIE